MIMAVKQSKVSGIDAISIILISITTKEFLTVNSTQAKKYLSSVKVGEVK
jgi:hypothetical protein